jgi:regulator of sirC expression with transglutaminase-like and TPR domain
MTGYNSGVDLPPHQLRSLAGLLDDEDPASYDLVRRQILGVGAEMLPYLDELRAAAGPELASRVDSMTGELRFHLLRRDFAALAADRDPDLERGALLISRFSYPGLDESVYRAWLDRVAAGAAETIPKEAGIGESVRALCAHLFGGMGFAGNETRYYDPDNSYLTRVIDTRRGIPVTLSVLLLLLARRLRLPLYGVGAPGHFLAGYREEGQPVFVDAFRGGRLMSLPEVRRMVVRNGYEWKPELVAPCPPREILARMLRNLISIYHKAGSGERAERLSTLVEIVLTGRDGGDEA